MKYNHHVAGKDMCVRFFVYRFLRRNDGVFAGGIPSGPGGDRAALEKLEQKKSAKLLKKEKPKPVVAPPVVDDTPFVLPDSVAKGCAPTFTCQ